MRLSDLPRGRYEFTFGCSGSCREVRVSETSLPGGPTGIPEAIDIEEAFNVGKFRCKVCHAPAGLLVIESIDPLGAKRTEVLRLRSWRA